MSNFSSLFFPISVTITNYKNEDNWNNTYTTVGGNSASWTQAYTNLVSNSTAYLSAYDMSLVNSNSSSWNTAYTNLVYNSTAYLSAYDMSLVNSNSSSWNTAYTNLVYNSTAYLSAYDMSLINSTSSNWDNTYTQYSQNSSSYATFGFVNGKFLPLSGGAITGNLTIQGNLTAFGTATFANTIFTTTSAVSVINTGPGPALYVFQAAGPSDVASFYDGDGIEVLHIGNATPGGNGFVGINESFPTVELSVRGAISASKTITALGGNSNQWNASYTNLVYNSTAYLSAYDMSLVNSNSASWNTAYTNLVYNSTAYLSGFNSTAITQNSANWNTAYTNLVYNSTAYLSAYDMSLVNSNSANWNSSYTTLNSISSIIPDPATTISVQIAVGVTTLSGINFLNTSVAQLLYTVPANKTFLVTDYTVIVDAVLGGNVADTSLPTFRLYRHDTLTNAINQVTNQLALTTPSTLITPNRYYRIGGSVTSSNGKALVSGNDASPQNKVWFRVDSTGTNTYTGLSGRVIVTGNLI